MPERRIHRKELRKKLKEDEVAVFMRETRESLGGFLERYGRLTFWSVLAVVLIAGIVTLWRWKYLADFRAAQELYGAAAMQLSNKDYRTAEDTLSELIQRFPNQDCVPAAYALRAFCLHRQKDYAGALADYQSALAETSDQATRYSLRISIAQCYRSLGQTEKAVAELEALREEVPEGGIRDEVTYLLARCKEDLDRPEEALALYNEISDDSDYKRIARDRISWLETRPVAPLNPVG